MPSGLSLILIGFVVFLFLIAIFRFLVIFSLSCFTRLILQLFQPVHITLDIELDTLLVCSLLLTVARQGRSFFLTVKVIVICLIGLFRSLEGRLFRLIFVAFSFFRFRVITRDTAF